MLKIRNDQMASLGNARIAAFLERARSFIASRIGRDVALSDIRTLYDRGKRYGLASEQDFARYFFVGVMIGSASEQDDPAWMHAILDVPSPSAELKLRRLFEAAQRHVPPGIAAAAGS